MLIQPVYNVGLGSTQRVDERLAQEAKSSQSLIENASHWQLQWSKKAWTVDNIPLIHVQ